MKFTKKTEGSDETAASGNALRNRAPLAEGATPGRASGKLALALASGLIFAGAIGTVAATTNCAPWRTYGLEVVQKDAEAKDGEADAADGQPDSKVPDAKVPDAFVPDAHVDAHIDAAPDAEINDSSVDAAIDSTVDAAPDSGVDAQAPDSGLDGGTTGCTGVHSEAVSALQFDKNVPTEVGGYDITYTAASGADVTMVISCASSGAVLLTDTFTLNVAKSVGIQDDNKTITITVSYWYALAAVADVDVSDTT